LNTSKTQYTRNVADDREEDTRYVEPDPSLRPFFQFLLNSTTRKKRNRNVAPSDGRLVQDFISHYHLYNPVVRGRPSGPTLFVRAPPPPPSYDDDDDDRSSSSSSSRLAWLGCTRSVPRKKREQRGTMRDRISVDSFYFSSRPFIVFKRETEFTIVGVRVSFRITSAHLPKINDLCATFSRRGVAPSASDFKGVCVRVRVGRRCCCCCCAVYTRFWVAVVVTSVCCRVTD